MLNDAALGLQAAHAAGFIHRDIKPSNVLRLDDARGRRWVVSDWGIVRRSDGSTTARHTQIGVFLGTEGFAPPEAYGDPHSAGFSWDFYSLGRLAAWATTGTWPTPLNEAVAPEPWRRFVRFLTENDAGRRPQDMARVIELLSLVASQSPALPGVAAATLSAAKAGDPEAAASVLRAAHEYEDDPAFFIDDVAELSGPGLDVFVREDPAAARKLLTLLDRHLEHISWGRRDFNHYNVPLHWMQRVAQAAEEAGELNLRQHGSMGCSDMLVIQPSVGCYKLRRAVAAANIGGRPRTRTAPLERVRSARESLATAYRSDGQAALGHLRGAIGPPRSTRGCAVGRINWRLSRQRPARFGRPETTSSLHPAAPRLTDPTDSQSVRPCGSINAMV